MVDALGVDVFCRLSNVEVFVADLHWCLLGQYRANFCTAEEYSGDASRPRESDLPLSSTKRRRLRAVRTRGQLWVASVAQRREPDVFVGF